MSSAPAHAEGDNVTEATPLLLTPRPDNNVPLEASAASNGICAETNGTAEGQIQTQEQTPARLYFQKHTRRMTWVIFTTSLVSLLLMIAVYLVVILELFLFQTWWVENSVAPMMVLLLFAFIISIINLAAPVPVLFNIPLDLLLSFWILVTCEFARQGWPNTSICWSHGSASERCLDVIRVIQILSGIGLTFGAVAGIVHLILVVLRIIAGFRTSFVTRRLPWRVPGGKISVEFSIGYSRQESREDERAGATTADAGAGAAV